MSLTQSTVVENHSSITKFDAFPKLPSTYKARSESRGFLTIFVAILSFLLVANDIGEYFWGWPDYQFNLDMDPSSSLNINVDILVNMPCPFLSVDLRDAIGDRLFLSSAIKRDGTLFDVGQATALQEHSTALSAQQAVAQSRKSRGLFATLFRSSGPTFRPTYNHQSDGSACRVYGSLEAKKVTANLHITTVGHGYASREHVDHKYMNLSHVINEFSFGPYFPEMVQPLDHSFEVTHEHFIAYQYFLSVVPTTYIDARGTVLKTNQYSVTHYTRALEHDRGTPGIFFKFDLEPLSLTIHQRTTSLIQFLIRCVGVVGGVWCCIGWALRVGYKAVEVVTGGGDNSDTIIVEARSSAIRKKWGGSDIRSRGAPRQDGWSSASGSPYSSHMNSPVINSGFPPTPHSATFNNTPPPTNGGYGIGLGLGLPSPRLYPSTPQNGHGPPSPALSSHSHHSQYSPAPNGNGSGFPSPQLNGNGHGQLYPAPPGTPPARPVRLESKKSD